jgi:hypothetical protein
VSQTNDGYLGRKLTKFALFTGVACGVVTNLEHCSPFSAMKAVQVDADCAEYGVGGVYGQLTAIGCKVSDIQTSSIMPRVTNFLPFVYPHTGVSGEERRCDTDRVVQ